MQKKVYFLFLVILLSIVVMGCENRENTKSISENQTTNEEQSTNTSEKISSNIDSSDPLTTNQTAVPTLFIHGYGGTARSFKGMLSRFEENSWGKNELTLTVQPDGIISEIGEWKNESNNPMIQVLFADNKNNEWNQAEWIKDVLTYLKTVYQINEVNLVGHSMGGVSSFRYLVTYGNEKTLPIVTNFVAIGAPFNDFLSGNEEQSLNDLTQNGPLVSSERYNDFTTRIKQYPKMTKMLNIVGNLQDGSEGDGTVSVRSGLSIGYLMQTTEMNYREEIVTGSQASHSQLHENTQVDELVADFIWSTP